MKVAIFVLCTLSAALASPASWRIVGGQDAGEGQFPYQASLRYFGTHNCGGSIIDETTILCAAHCVDQSSTIGMTVRVGNNKLNAQTEEYGVKTFIVHKSYDPQTFVNDISIIKLRKPITFHDGVEAVKLRQTNIGDADDVVLSGWGTTILGGSTPNDLQWIKLRTFPVDKCGKALETSEGLSVFDTQVCTFTHEGEGSCHGDSGGPLVDANGEQIGIVSWGYQCAKGYPDVSTRVYSYLDWIEANRH